MADRHLRDARVEQRVLVKFFKDILTADAKSSVYDLVRVSFAIAFVVGLVLQAYVVFAKDAPFDIQAFGTGFGLMIAGAGGAMALRKDRES